MRLRQLELIRYGGYADRALDFGDGATDLHLIVGANEAGKSTLLAAIGDWLFGFPGQTTQDWRFDYRDLRILAVVEQAGQRLEAIRRKGNKNTLLGPDGAALADDALSALIGGVDRLGFERLFGLDHAKLRLGGQAILDGKDDAARAMFEAGTGLASVTAELKRLESRCASLFKPSASNPEVNRLLRERAEALKTVRDSSLGDADLTRIKDTQADAERRRADLTAEGEALTARANAAERVARTRAPLSRLAAAREGLDALGSLPVLSPDAEARLREARAERATAIELRAAQTDKAQTAAEALTRLVPPEAILAARSRIEALAEQRPAVDKAQDDRPRRIAELERIDAALAAARAEAGLPAGADLPSDAWRRRARTHLDAWRALDQRAAKLAADRAEQAADGEARLAELAVQARKTAERLAAGLSRLGWTGTPADLAGARLPAPPEAAEYGRRIDQAREGLKTALDAAETARLEAARQQRRIEILTQGPQLPTPEAVAAARATRDAALAEVRRRLAEPRRADDGEAGLHLAEGVLHADALADRRDGESQRLAEYALAADALAAAGDGGEAAARAADRWRAALAEAEGAWATVLAEAGLPRTLLPAGFESWRADRLRILEEAAAASEPPPSLALDRRAAALDREADQIVRDRADLDRDRDRLRAEVDAAWPDPSRLADALAALDAVVADAGKRGGVAQQLEGIDRDLRAFAADVAALLSELDRPPHPRAGETVRGLARDLADAVKIASDIGRWTAEAEAAAAALKTVDRRLAAAEGGIAALAAAAGAADETALDAVLAACARALEHRKAESAALDDLADLGEGRDLADLRADAAALSPDDAAAARDSIGRRRQEIDLEREAIGRSLAETQAAFDHAARTTEAADAQQAAADAGAALAASAERYVETAAAAALLKWLVERHRAGAQAPLLARASDLFATVTAGSFVRLALDYDDDDRPRIVAVRPDGSRVGVEGMSEGTRDQLFLALRLGALQGHPGGSPLPLVCDDLLITSDDARAGAILGLLKAASASMQVLVFTHHDHIVDVAGRAIGAEGFRLHRLAAGG